MKKIVLLLVLQFYPTVGFTVDCGLYEYKAEIIAVYDGDTVTADIDLDNAKILGLIPDLPNEKVEIIGNGSLAGSFLALIEPDALNTYRELALKPEVVELNLIDEFQNNFIEALMIPNLEENDFPEIYRNLKKT